MAYNLPLMSYNLFRDPFNYTIFISIFKSLNYYCFSSLSSFCNHWRDHEIIFSWNLDIDLSITFFFSTVIPFSTCIFLSCRPFVVKARFSTGLVVCWSFFCLLTWAGLLTTQARKQKNFNTLQDGLRISR